MSAKKCIYHKYTIQDKRIRNKRVMNEALPDIPMDEIIKGSRPTASRAIQMKDFMKHTGIA